MFGYISGHIFDLKATKVIVMTGGIGFSVNITPSYAEKLRTGKEANFWIHTAVRENSIDLYGFETEAELNIFELLLTVSGVGPKSALSILSVAGITAIEEAVISSDTTALTKISGIGRKTADKIVIELRGKVFGTRKQTGKASENIDVYEALRSLGYREKDIQDLLKDLPTDLIGTNEKIKYALKNLGK